MTKWSLQASPTSKPVRRAERIQTILRNAAMLGLCAVLLAMGRCTTVVIPPAHPVDPTTAYICNYGIHSSLLLPRHNGRWVEYLYGDWNWAVLGQKGALNGGRALFFSSQSALGRRYLVDAPGQKIPMPPERPQMTAVTVNGPGIRKLIGDLDARFARQSSFTFQQSESEGGYLYVKDRVHYSVLHDCNSTTAEGLREMGCTTAGLPVWSDFTVENRKLPVASW